jgi:hypothetical protein
MRSFSRSFSGGEVTPEFFGQIADSKYQTGLAKCRNFVVLPHGPVQNRAGFEFVREVKDSRRHTRLVPFEYSTTQTMVLELGEQYVRFHTQGATLLQFGAPYEVATPYSHDDVFTIKYVQSADVLTLVSTLYAPAELRRLGALNWTHAPVTFATTLQPPTSITATATAGATPGTPTSHVYAVTSVGGSSSDESLISASATCSNNLFDNGAFNTIGWAAATSAVRYNVYKKSNGLWGYVGQASGTSFVDDNITPDISKTPPEANNPFVGAGNYPGAVTYFEQRRAFAGTINQPQNLWLTRSGTESNLTYSIPSRDSDSISFRVIARQANTVRHLVPLVDLLALTSSAEWRITSGGDVLTPSTTGVKPQSFIGAGEAQPVMVSNNVLYAAARGGHVREMAYNWQAGGYLTGDVSLRAPHLFDGLEIVDMAFSKSPIPVVWMVSSSGLLLGLTYVPEQQLGAWHWHDTDGAFESCCVVAEGAEDVLYVVVRRAIGGVSKRYVERMHTRAFTEQAGAFFVDCGLSYSGPAVSTVAGLSHLEGKTVSILADGAAHRQLVVSGGSITLDEPASTVQVGLPITADLQTLPLALEIPGFGQGTRKNVNKVYLRVKDSSGIRTGPDFGSLVEAKIRMAEPPGTPPALQTREIEVVNRAAWTDGAQVCIRQSDPLPLTIVSLTLDVAVGG